MASPTKMVVGKSIPNPLIAKDLLKILRDLIPCTLCYLSKKTILHLQRLRIEKKLVFFKPNEKFSTTHHAEGNSMARPTQMAVGKGKQNLLIAKDLLKILRDLIPF